MSDKVRLFQKRLSDGTIENSLSRVLSALTVVAGLSLGLVAVLTSTLTGEAVGLSLGLVGLGITGKVVSGGIER